MEYRYESAGGWGMTVTYPLTGQVNEAERRPPLPVRLLELLPGTYPGAYKRNVIVLLVYVLLSLVGIGLLWEALPGVW